MSIRKSLKLGFTNMDIADICPNFLNKNSIKMLKERCLVMEESTINQVDETVWYENDQPIKEFLESFRKPAILEADHQAEELSWVKIMYNSN